ncbi:hypothetical protein VNI00_009179 [Paramarasmius palmivorus]|uniref:Uncharacterized protein n=1 Tax=Paramarasmius palmivorus TaxID=297713 RepID=A0AAW0CP89_9AGAR
MTEATLVPLGTGNQETTYLYVLNGTQMDITLEATLVASASGHRIIATDYPQECHWTASDSGECLLEAVQDGTTEPISTMVGTPIEIVLPVSATAVELGGSDSVSTSTPTSSGTQGSSGGTQTTPTGSGGGSATTQSPGSNGTVSRSIASSVLVALALMLSGAFAAQAQTQYLTINQFGIGSGDGENAGPATTTVTDATLIPVGTANAETTYIFVENDTTETTTITFVASASGYKALATDYPQNCYFTAPDSGVCELGGVADGTTETFTTTGAPYVVVIPVAAPTGAGDALGSGGNNGSNGAVPTQSGGSNGAVSALKASSGIFGSLLGGIVAGVALVL